MKLYIRTILIAVLLNINIFTSTGAHAALVSTLSGQVVNDTDLNITWLANGNLAATETFGVNGIALDGTMTWQTAQLWIAAMNAANYLGYNDWRLPTTTTDTCTPGCNFSFSGTAWGYNNPDTSEMSHLYHIELGNKGFYDTAGAGPLSGWGLVNTSPFSNLQAGLYWSGTEYASDTGFAWDYGFDFGYQAFFNKNDLMFALAVRPGQIDTIPTAFSFTAQSGAALSSVATSNTITITGINSGSAISIVGGTYSINGGTYVSTAGTVANGDTVTLQQTASGSYSTTTIATLTIGGVGGAFNVTTLAIPVAITSYSALSATGSGSITASFTGGGTGCGYVISQYIPLSGHAASPPAGTAPAGAIFPQGLFDFSASNCAVGATLVFTITYPQALSSGTIYWKYGPAAGNISPHWYQLPAVIAGNTATFSITDGGLGDDDLTANGTIVDQGGPGVSSGAAVSIPTLTEWVLLTLAGLLGLCGMGVMRRRSFK
ncbi:MAG: choice-of-anchor U domain-containing protein [Candidatus Nitrotoga sp.]|nr:choice-of-anchor U domain-containing protein [Candidatus Nitrotoga sp.]MDP1855307.1 choice-of-anchor U domain-containing protein [Candidatus Nitrotoga sp.]